MSLANTLPDPAGVCPGERIGRGEVWLELIHFFLEAEAGFIFFGAIGDVLGWCTGGQETAVAVQDQTSFGKDIYDRLVLFMDCLLVDGMFEQLNLDQAEGKECEPKQTGEA